MFKNIFFTFIAIFLLTACGVPAEVETAVDEIEIQNEKEVVEKSKEQEEFHAELSVDDDLFTEREWKKYRNEELGFEMMYPGGWYVEDEGVIRFSNYESMDKWRDLIAKKDDNIEDFSAIYLWVFDKRSETFEEVRAGYDRRSEDVISFATNKNEIALYVDSVRGAVMNESWDVVVPDFKAFVELENYNLMFYTGMSSRDTEEQERKLELLKNALRTFNFF